MRETNVIHVLLVVVRRGVRQAGARVVRHHVEIVAHLVLLRPADVGVKRRAKHLFLRPRLAGVLGIPVEELGIVAAGIVPRVEPDDVDSPVRGDRHGAEPLVGTGARILIDALRGAPRLPTVRAAGEHDVTRVRGRVARHRAAHVDVAVGRAVRMIGGDPHLPQQAAGVRTAGIHQAAVQIRRRGQVPHDRLTGVLGAGRSDDGVRVAANEQLTVRPDRERAPLRAARNGDARLVGLSAVGRTSEVAGVANAPRPRPIRVDVALPDTLGLVDDHPLLVTTVSVGAAIPRRATVGGFEDVTPVVGTLEGQAVVIEVALHVGIEHRVGAEHAGLDLAGESPALPAVGGVAPPSLAKIAADRVELPPADAHAARVRHVDRDRRLVGGVTDDVVAVLVHVDLHADVPVPLNAGTGCSRLPLARGRHVRVLRRFQMADLVRRSGDLIGLLSLSQAHRCDHHDDGGDLEHCAGHLAYPPSGSAGVPPAIRAESPQWRN